MNHAKRSSIFLTLFDSFTLIVWAWLLISFVNKGRFDLPEYVSTVYLLILAYYVGDKEIRRHRKKYLSRARRGEYFVFLWGITLVAMVGFYVWGGNNLGYKIPTELPTIAGSVLVLYFLTEYLKHESGEDRK